MLFIRNFIFILASIQVYSTAYAFNVNSAVRGANEDYRAKMFPVAYDQVQGWLREPPIYRATPETHITSAITLAKPLSSFNKSAVAEWPEKLEINEAFFSIRDTRFIPTEENFLRRPSWLFPEDGCYARAEISNHYLETRGFPKAQKIFVFGNLKLATEYALSGKVQWWYHVALAYRINHKVFILDPVADVNAPIDFDTWIIKMGSPEDIKVAVCAPDAFTPRKDCLHPQAMTMQEAFDEQLPYLKEEWDNLLSLKHDPIKDLGDLPPWKH